MMTFVYKLQVQKIVSVQNLQRIILFLMLQPVHSSRKTFISILMCRPRSTFSSPCMIPIILLSLKMWYSGSLPLLLIYPLTLWKLQLEWFGISPKSAYAQHLHNVFHQLYHAIFYSKLYSLCVSVTEFLTL